MASTLRRFLIVSDILLKPPDHQISSLGMTVSGVGLSCVIRVVSGLNHLCRHTALLCPLLASGSAITLQSPCLEVMWACRKVQTESTKAHTRCCSPAEVPYKASCIPKNVTSTLSLNVPWQDNLVILVSTTSIPALTQHPGCIWHSSLSAGCLVQ